MRLAGIKSRYFPDLATFHAFVRYVRLNELRADTQARLETSGFFAKKLQERIGNPTLLPPTLAAATLIARSERKGYYAQIPMAGTGIDSTLQWTGKYKRSITYGNVATRESGVGSDDPKAVWFELGTLRMPKREPMAATARDHNDEAFLLYADRFITILFNL